MEAAPRGAQSNAELARIMLIVGIVLLALAAALTFLDGWLINLVRSDGGSFVLHAWSVIVQLGYPLGSFLIVGSIIVTRLPQQPLSSE